MRTITSLICALAILGGISFANAESCCDRAKKEGKECPHKCCQKAKQEGKVCEKCNPKKESKDPKDSKDSKDPK